MHDQFKVLITLLHAKKEYLKVSSHCSNQKLKMHLTHAGGTTIFILIQAFGLLSIEWEEEHLKQRRHTRDWYYSENANQEKIFHQINNEVESYVYTDSNLPENYYHEYGKNTIVLSESKNIDVGDIFTIALLYTKQLNAFQKLSEEGVFEVLTFNCVYILQITKEFRGHIHFLGSNWFRRII